MTDQSESSQLPPGAVILKIETTDPALHIAPVIHIDGAGGFVANDQIVKFNLFQDRLVAVHGKDPQIPLERVVCARLVMTTPVFKQLMDWLAQVERQVFPNQNADGKT